jgi:GDP-L-fucose synthase
MAEMVKELVGYTGDLVLDPTKPDGAPYKTVDGSRGYDHFGWGPQRNFKEGIADAIQWYVNNGNKNG